MNTSNVQRLAPPAKSNGRQQETRADQSAPARLAPAKVHSGFKPGWLILVGLAVAWMVFTDVGQLKWVAQVSGQGSPPPQRDVNSPTGYVDGQRQFLGAHERGETFRWIETTQAVMKTGLLGSAHETLDNVPAGRPRLAPRLYAGWMMAISWTVHAVTGDPLPIAVERAALWEPIVTHILVLLAATGLVTFRAGPGCAAVVAALIAAHPLVANQFLSGTLTPRTGALVLASAALSTIVLPMRPGQRIRAAAMLGPWSAITAGLALWLDPQIGFPTILILGVASASADKEAIADARPLLWSCFGALIGAAGWAIDLAPWNASAGELRYVHPYYAFAWLAVGVALHGRRMIGTGPRWKPFAAWAAAVLLLTPLGATQIARHYWGWFYPSASLHRLTSLDETTIYRNASDWLGSSLFTDVMLVLFPTALALVALGSWLVNAKTRAMDDHVIRTPVTVAFAAILLLSWFEVRWLVVSSLLAVPLCWTALRVSQRRLAIRAIFAGSAILLIVLAAGLTSSRVWRKPSGPATASSADVDALIYRHLAHWLASHSARSVAALAPPEVSDSLIFHGGIRVLVSTAWECYDGQVAASRILSAPEATEAEAVLQSREITHLILTSWDKVLPLLVREPKEQDRTTLYGRLQRWVLPPYLRALPYRLPPTPGYEAEKVAVFKVTAPQDEALLLSRLAEYFIEVERPDPAAAVAKILTRSFAEDPNARIACATVAAAGSQAREFERELRQLAADPTAGDDTMPWDRRVQRGIIFALGGKHDLARAAIASCLDGASVELVSELTPLQAYRLLALMRRYELSFSDAHLTTVVEALCTEYGKR